ncbi:NADH-quinone oxidoreductase subunit NuoE [Armatimonas sp.]|uniref:NADH-quinone oxidoreductase subunit NuoE family protein n=1 Tax=Armatimonas sp. TaxID=1872638 RepID=UPI003750F38D
MGKFTATDKARLDELISRYPTKKAALLPALWVAQEVYGGWLPLDAMEEVAVHLELPTADVQGVATFYTMYNKEPRGQHAIEICHNVSCMVLGAEQLIQHCERRLGVSATGETTTDGIFTLARVECLGACCNAPAVQVGGTYYENVSFERMDALLETLKTASSEVVNPPQAGLPEMKEL